MSGMDWHDLLSRFWPHLVAGFHVLAAGLTTTHALLHKRDARAATLWVGVVWLMPVLGSVLYLVLGVNRIRRRALALGITSDVSRPLPVNYGEPEPEGARHLEMLARVVGRVVAHPLSPGNQITPLVNGDAAFPAMLAALESAQTSVSLASYIFDNDAVGRRFADALGRATARGVAVRVLVDAAGSRYSWPSILHRLKHARVPSALFLPSSLLAPWRAATINLRNHRKILVVDGRTAFTGGMNLRQGNLLAAHPRHPVQDLHFRVEGPVVTHLQEAFVNDWAFTTKEVLAGENWFPGLTEAGGVTARVIMDGPDGDFHKLRWTLLAALTEAQSSIQIVTPYFLPDPALIAGLNLAALRGVRVDILLPAKNNLHVVHWASRALWWQVLERGCHVWLTPPPFDHSKLMVVDDHWVLLGSANWDTRSLRLNFELNLEGYGREFARTMRQILEQKLRGAHEVTLAEADGRSIPAKLRDAIARLFTPFL
jgi:cardiolipin synthase